jgi:hypothetical protein
LKIKQQDNIVKAWLINKNVKYSLVIGKDHAGNKRAYWINLPVNNLFYKAIQEKINLIGKLVVNLKLDTNYYFENDPILDIAIYNEKNGVKTKINGVVSHNIKKSRQKDKFVYKIKLDKNQQQYKSSQKSFI